MNNNIRVFAETLSGRAEADNLSWKNILLFGSLKTISFSDTEKMNV